MLGGLKIFRSVLICDFQVDFFLLIPQYVRSKGQGCIAVKNLFKFSIKVKFFRTTAREVKDKFFREKLNYNFPQLSK